MSRCIRRAFEMNTIPVCHPRMQQASRKIEPFPANPQTSSTPARWPMPVTTKRVRVSAKSKAIRDAACRAAQMSLGCIMAASAFDLRARPHASDLGDVCFVKCVDLVNLVSHGDQRCDDRSGAGSKYYVKTLVQRALDHALNLLQHAKRVEAFCSPAIKAENTKQGIAGRFGRQVRFQIHSLSSADAKI